MQSVLTRTLDHARRAAEREGLDTPTPAMMELKLIQSKAEIESPEEGVQAHII